MGAPPKATLASVSGHHPKRQPQPPAFPSPSCPTDEKQRVTRFLFFLREFKKNPERQEGKVLMLGLQQAREKQS